MIISRTPLRVSLFGGGSDFADYYEHSRFGYGAVLSTSINMYTYMTVNRKFDDMIRVSYSKTEHVDDVRKVEHNIIREAMKITGVTKGVDIVYMADVPLASTGVGLASSSALAVGVLNALYAYNGIHASADRLAKEACRIEIDRLKNPIGKQDQYAVAFGGLRRYQFNADGTVFDDPIISNKHTMETLQRRLMFFYTGKTRRSSTVLKEQKGNIPDKKHALDKLVEIVNKAQRCIEGNDLLDIGVMLDDAWKIKRSLASRVSNDEIDEMYEKARKAGALGGKILGAGGGGFLMLYVMEEKQDDIKKALSKYRMVDIRFEPQGSKIIYVSE